MEVSSLKVSPLVDRVVVRPVELQLGAIIVVSGAEGEPRHGEVIAVGPGRMELGKRVKMTVKLGNRVLYNQKAGDVLMVGGCKCLIMHEYQIMAIVEGGEVAT
ncbi:hypothetical protein LCGC14_1549140 [marine sediment metagenome]|uniref:10 kDa chaperonin n=1 Tax=marine sediment metagenome TaxID=412755 RepID=A0A0F9L6V4_9ZZZZ